MRKTACLAGTLGAALIVATSANAQYGGEFALPPAGGDFVLGWIGPAPGLMHEYVPRGETVEGWTRMVTIVSMPWRIGLTPRAVVARLAQAMASSCTDGSASEIEASPLGGRDGASVRVTCPINPQTGRPETMFARAIQGEESIVMVQAALRRAPSEADTRWATGVLAGTRLCTARDTTSRCKVARTAAVGSPL